MTLLQYKTRKYGRIYSKVFISKRFAEQWVHDMKCALKWWQYRRFNDIVLTTGEMCFEFVESERTY